MALPWPLCLGGGPKTLGGDPRTQMAGPAEVGALGMRAGGGPKTLGGDPRTHTAKGGGPEDPWGGGPRTPVRGVGGRPVVGWAESRGGRPVVRGGWRRRRPCWCAVLEAGPWWAGPSPVGGARRSGAAGVGASLGFWAAVEAGLW